MSDSTLVVWDDVFTSYDFGPTHPMRPLRLELTMALSRQLGVLDRPGVTVGAPTAASDDLLQLVHDPMYVASVKRAPDDLMGRLSLRYGLGTSDVPVFARMHESAALVTGATVDAARAVWTGTAPARREHLRRPAPRHARPGVGLLRLRRPRGRHRLAARPGRDAGGVRRRRRAPRRRGRGGLLRRPAGADGLDPRERPHAVPRHRLGRPGRRGEGVGPNVNVALPMGTGDAGWLRAFEAVVPQVLRAFAPQVILTQHGCDTHALDPLAHIMKSVEGQRVAYRRLHELAHELCDGRWIAVGGGGYEPVQVVPRAWTHLLAEVTGAPLDGATPEDWRELARRTGGETAPTSLTDGPAGSGDPAFVPWEGGHGNPDDPVDRAVLETREAVFPHLGLDALVAQG
jgi:acetoin utilization protein AcuC